MKQKSHSPFCTAVQIGQVNLLRHAGVRFDAVIGHSSGEIGAAYAAGYLTERDAILISYYRGQAASLASGYTGEAGGMLAAGISILQTQQLIDSTPVLISRVCVAASNSPESVTLSGDESAIGEIKAILDRRNMFCRILRVDTAYHSHHMQGCIEQYRTALRALHIVVQTPDADCTWVSSVDEGCTSPQDLEHEYWVKNMANAVLFSQAIETVLRNKRFGFAIEVGPHPALQGPFDQTRTALNQPALPYTSLLMRNRDALSTFAASLGALWQHIGPRAVDLVGFETACIGFAVEHRLVSGLPAYSWDHDQTYWKESRPSAIFRQRPIGRHDLLGSQL